MAPKPVVVLHTDKPEESLSLFKEYHPDLEVHTCNTYEQLPSTIESTQSDVIYSVRFAGTPNYPRQSLLNSPSVKWVSVGGSGTDHLHPWNPDTLTVTNAAGVAADMMAEYVLGTVLSFRLNLRGFHSAQQQHQWTAGSVKPIEGSTVLIIGLGHTGQAVAKRCKSMGMKVIGTRARVQATEHVDEVHAMDALHTLLPQADVVVCCVPLLPSTEHLLSRKEFSVLKPTALLVDVSRGGVIDQSALIDALNQKKLEGAALDVFSTEPLPTDSPLWDMQNVIITPHCSSVYEGWALKSVALFADNMTRYVEGEPLNNIVDPVRGY